MKRSLPLNAIEKYSALNNRYTQFLRGLYLKTISGDNVLYFRSYLYNCLLKGDMSGYLDYLNPKASY